MKEKSGILLCRSEMYLKVVFDQFENDSINTISMHLMLDLFLAIIGFAIGYDKFK